MPKSQATEERPCAHLGERLVAYLANERGEHTSSVWCPECGALGTKVYGHGSPTTWSHPRVRPRRAKVSSGVSAPE